MDLKIVMKYKDVTTRRLSDLTGIPARTIEGYRQGRREPSFTAGLKICDALGIDPHVLTDAIN